MRQCVLLTRFRLNSIIDDMQQAKPPSDNDRHILQTLEKLKAAVYNQ